MIVQSESFAINKALNHGNLLNQSLILGESISVDLVEILAQNVVIEAKITSLVGSKVQNGAAYLKQILLKITLSGLLRIRSDLNIAVTISQDDFELPIAIISILMVDFLQDILVNKMQSFKCVQQVERHVRLNVIFDDTVVLFEKVLYQSCIGLVIYVFED